MKQILLVLTILWCSVTIILMVSCKPETPEVEQPQNYTNWEVEVKYLDKTVDTIVVRSIDRPFLYISDHVSIVTQGDSYAPVASYVKSANILN